MASHVALAVPVHPVEPVSAPLVSDRPTSIPHPVLLAGLPAQWARTVATVLDAVGQFPLIIPAGAPIRPPSPVAAVLVTHHRLADVVRRLPRGEGWVPVVAVTGPDTLDAVVEALERGADDCVSSEVSMPELMLRLDRLITRPQPRRAPHITRGELVLDLDRRTVSVHGEPISLSATQFDLLVELAATPGRPVSVARLLSVGWDAHQEVSSALLRPQLARLRKALGAAATIDAERGRGYRLDLHDAGRDHRTA